MKYICVSFVASCISFFSYVKGARGKSYFVKAAQQIKVTKQKNSFLPSQQTSTAETLEYLYKTLFCLSGAATTGTSAICIGVVSGQNCLQIATAVIVSDGTCAITPIAFFTTGRITGRATIRRGGIVNFIIVVKGRG